MNSKLLVSAVILFASFNIQADVKTLNSESDYAKDKVAVVKCFANWCGHCKTFAPVYETIAKENSDKANFYQADADSAAGKEFAGKYKVQGFPTTIVFVNGKEHKKIVGGNEAELRESIKSAQNAPVEDVVVKANEVNANSVVQEATSSAYLKQPGVVVVKFYADWCELCKPYAPAYESVAQDYSTFAKFFQVDVDKYPEIQQEFEINGLPRTLVLDSGKVVDTISGANDSRLTRTLKSLKNGTPVILPVSTKVKNGAVQEEPVKKVKKTKKIKKRTVLA